MATFKQRAKVLAELGNHEKAVAWLEKNVEQAKLDVFELVLIPPMSDDTRIALLELRRGELLDMGETDLAAQVTDKIDTLKGVRAPADR